MPQNDTTIESPYDGWAGTSVISREALRRQMNAALGMSRASSHWTREMREGADAMVNYLCASFRIELEDHGG